MARIYAEQGHLVALLQIGVHDGHRWTTTAVSVPMGMQCVVFTPDTPMNTTEARAMLPPQVWEWIRWIFF